MRAIFGLVGLLVVCGIIIAVMMVGGHPADTVRRAEPAKRQVEQMAGVNSEGERVENTIKFEPLEVNGKFRGLLVDDIKPGGMMEMRYGLEKGDLVIEAAATDLLADDAQMARELVIRGYQMSAPVVVLRDGQKLTLPQDRTRTAAPSKKPMLQKQLDNITAPR